MQKLNVQVHDDLFYEVEKYARKYRISRAAAVSCLLSLGIENSTIKKSMLISERPFKRGGSG